MTAIDLPPGARAELDGLLADADHVDVKTIEADRSLREFVAAVQRWEPAWVRALFGARAVLAWVLRLKQAGEARAPRVEAADIPFEPGSKVSFFTVVAAAEDEYLVMAAEDTHLTGYLAVVVEPVTAGRNRFRVLTIVRYHRWTGPFYFNLIRPFHHLVVGSMVRAGARGALR